MQWPKPEMLPDPPSGKKGWPWTSVKPGDPQGNDGDFSWPMISVVIPSYNQGRFLEQSIRSVLLQDYPAIECIVIDGGSSDESVEIISRYEKWLTYWISESDRGQSHAINKGIAKATGEIFFWLNADDICMPGSFYMAAKAFMDPRRPRLVVGSAHYINEDGEILGTWRHTFTSWQDYALKRTYIRQVATFFDRSLFDELGGLDEGLEYCMDRELLLRFTKRYEPLVIPEALAAFRIHEANRSRGVTLKGIRESYYMTLIHLKDTPWLDEFITRSAFQWTKVPLNRSLSFKDTLYCYFEALRLRPGLILTKKWWINFFKGLLKITS